MLGPGERPYDIHNDIRVFKEYEAFTQEVDLQTIENKLQITGRTKYLRSYINKIDEVIEGYWQSHKRLKIEMYKNNMQAVTYFNTKKYSRKFYIYMNGEPDSYVFNSFRVNPMSPEEVHKVLKEL